MPRRVTRYALNRGTAVYLGENKVRFVSPCGCTHVERLVAAAKRPCSAEVTQRLVKYWRANGITLKLCRKHPEFYSKLSVLAKLNTEHPQTQVRESIRVTCQYCKCPLPLQANGTLPFHGDINGSCRGSEQRPGATKQESSHAESKENA